MSAEIKINLQLTYANGYAAASFAPGQISITQSAQGGEFPIVSVTTTPTAVSFGSVSTPGFVIGRSLAASTSTGYVLIGPTTSSTAGVAYYPFMKVKGGEPFCFRMNSNLWKWAANDGTIKVQAYILDN